MDRNPLASPNGWGPLDYRNEWNPFARRKDGGLVAPPGFKQIVEDSVPLRTVTSPSPSSTPCNLEFLEPFISMDFAEHPRHEINGGLRVMHVIFFTCPKDEEEIS